MIYRTKFFKEELSYGYFERKQNVGALIGLGAFAGMLAFSIYFILQTLSKSVLSDQASFLVQQSYHTTELLYLAVSYVMVWIYLTARFQMATFSEVYENSWYGLVHQGYRVVTLVLGKLFAQLFGMLVINTAGFLTTLVMSSFLKFPLIPGYLVSMFLVGTFNCASLLILAMAASLVVREISNARSLFSVGAFLLFALQIMLGFFSLVTDRDSIMRVSALFYKSAYLYVDIAVMLVCVLVCVLKGSQIARLYNAPELAELPDLDHEPGTTLVVRTESEVPAIQRAAQQLSASYQPKKRGNLLSSLVSAVVVIAVLIMFAVDAVMLAFSYASPERETSIMGYIPYIFQSTTMEPSISYNDIAFFEVVDEYVLLNVDDIVLYKDTTGIVQVRRIIEKQTDAATGVSTLEVDIDYYPEGSQKGILHGYTAESSVYGRLAGVNRWLGVVVLLANSMIGRILFMLIPIILLFFNKQINDFFKRIGDPARRGTRAQLTEPKK
ncbi:MAG: hypothetical protein ABFC31_03265 [Clostridiaceae bacterium]